MKQLEIFRKNRDAGKYVVVMSTDITTKDKNILDAVFKFHKVSDIQSAKKYARLFLRELIHSFDFDYIQVNPNRYFVFTDKESAKLFVERADSWFGQESIIAFGPDCTYDIHEEPIDYSTKIDDVYVVFNFDGDVLETPPVPEDNRDTKTEVTEEDEMLKDKLVYENEKVKCYENAFTRIATRDCQKDYRGRDLKGHYVLLVELKETGERNYVLFNDKSQAVYVSKQYDAIGVRINMLKLLQESSSD